MSLVALMVTGLAFAEGKPPAGKAINAKRAEAKKGPCAADVQKFCAQVEKKKGDVRKCLKENEAKLSDACKKNIADAKANKAKVSELKGKKAADMPAKKPAIPAAEGC